MPLLTKEISERMVRDLGGERVASFINSVKEATDSGSFQGLVISTEHVDRAGETLMQDGMDASLFWRNPVVLNSHDSWGIENIIGVPTRLYSGMVDGVKATLADGNWAPTDQGQTARKLWDAGILRAASVGFMDMERDKANSSIITKWQLLEFSMVAIPCNAYATRLKAIGLTAAGLIAKGFQVDENDKPEEKAKEPTVDEAIGFISKQNEETIRSVISKLTGLLKPGGADNQEVKRSNTPERGGTKQVPVHVLNSAIRKLLGVKKDFNS